MCRMVVWVMLGASILLPAAADDEVILKNGDKLTGKIVVLSRGKLALETKHSGVVSVGWGEIASIKSESAVKVKLATGEFLEGPLTPGEAGRLRIASAGAAGPVEVEMGKVAGINEPPTTWHGAIDIAARATDGNTHTTGTFIALEATRVSEIDEFIVRGVSRYGEKSGELQERNTYGLIKYQYLFSDSFYGYGSVELLSDKFKDLSLRTIVSAGAGYKMVQESWIDLSAEAGIAWVDNNHRDAADEDHLGGRVAAHLRLALPLGLSFTDDAVWFPNFDEGEDWQLRNEAGLMTSLGEGWTLKAGVISEVDNETPAGVERRDDTYFLTLGFRF